MLGVDGPHGSGVSGIALRDVRSESADDAVLAVVVDVFDGCGDRIRVGGLRDQVNVTVCGHGCSVPHPPYESLCLSTRTPVTFLTTIPSSIAGARSSGGPCSPTASATSCWPWRWHCS